jgi:hypothetical protein
VSRLSAVFGRWLGASPFFRFVVLLLFSSMRRARLCQRQSSRRRHYERHAALCATVPSWARHLLISGLFSRGRAGEMDLRGHSASGVSEAQ